MLLMLAALCLPMPLARALACATVSAVALSWDVVALWREERRRQLLTEREWDRVAERVRDAHPAMKMAKEKEDTSNG